MSIVYFLIFLFTSATSAFALNNQDPAMIGDLNTVFGSVVRALIPVCGFAAFAMLVYGGFKFLAAGSDKDATQKAQQTINYAVGGLLISLCAWLILNLIGLFLGVNLNIFNICINSTGC
jgi:hypothetical protein